MARRKKTAQAAVIEKEQVSYSGQVKLSVQKGKKTLSTKTYHNAGTSKLFEFICEALAGNFRRGMLPSKIALFDAESSEVFNDESTWIFTKAHMISPLIAYDTTALAVSDSSVAAITSGYKVTYSFRIPANYVFGQEVYKIALYNAETTDVVQALDESNGSKGRADPVAYFGLINQEGWEPMQIDQSGANFSILLEWTLLVQNSTN